MLIKDVLLHIEEIAPLALQESYDNSGLIIGNARAELKGIVVCLDSTEEVIDEAISKGYNLVIAHHPIIFQGLKRLTGKNYIQRTVMKAIKHDIAIYACHTNLDNVLKRGVNDKIAEKLGIINIRPILPKASASFGHESNLVGTGLIGELSERMDEMKFLNLLKDKMDVNCLKYTKLLSRGIKKIALCGGAGSFLLKHALKEKVDIYISSDFKYHEYFNADGHLIITDIGHYESEQFTIDVLNDIISDKFSNFAPHCTKINTNPVNYL